MPAARGVALQHFNGQITTRDFKGGTIFSGGQRCRLKRTLQAIPHLASGLVGEGNGQHFGRMLSIGQHGQQTLNQQLGLARPGGGLHDEGFMSVKRLTARRLIALQVMGCVGDDNAIGHVALPASTALASSGSAASDPDNDQGSRQKDATRQLRQVVRPLSGATSATPC